MGAVIDRLYSSRSIDDIAEASTIEQVNCRLRRFVPDNAIAVAESGVHSAEDVRRLAEMGADAILVGEALVTAPDVAAKVQELASVGTVGTEKPFVKAHRK